MMLHNVFDKVDTTIVCGEDNVFASFLQEKGLYDCMDITEENIEDLIVLIDGRVRINSYCTECKTERVFTMNPITFFTMCGDEYDERKLADEAQFLQKNIYGSDTDHRKEKGGEWQWKNWQIDEIARVLVFKFVCSMNSEHHLDFVAIADNKTFRKIGQYPSIADLSFPELDVYQKVLSTEDRKEFGRAIGLYASGIGAGSYVYLRRIFERLLFQAKVNAGDSIDEEAFEKARVDAKITMLSDHLPKLLTGNPTLYGVLSKGIHELTEKECIEYFPVVRDCIFMILNEWEEMRKRKEKEESIGKALSQIASKVK